MADAGSLDPSAPTAITEHDLSTTVYTFDEDDPQYLNYRYTATATGLITLDTFLSTLPDGSAPDSLAAEFASLTLSPAFDDLMGNRVRFAYAVQAGQTYDFIAVAYNTDSDGNIVPGPVVVQARVSDVSAPVPLGDSAIVTMGENAVPGAGTRHRTYDVGMGHAETSDPDLRIYKGWGWHASGAMYRNSSEGLASDFGTRAALTTRLLSGLTSAWRDTELQHTGVIHTSSEDLSDDEKATLNADRGADPYHEGDSGWIDTAPPHGVNGGDTADVTADGAYTGWTSYDVYHPDFAYETGSTTDWIHYYWDTMFFSSLASYIQGARLTRLVAEAATHVGTVADPDVGYAYIGINLTRLEAAADSVDVTAPATGIGHPDGSYDGGVAYRQAYLSEGPAVPNTEGQAKVVPIVVATTDDTVVARSVVPARTVTQLNTDSIGLYAGGAAGDWFEVPQSFTDQALAAEAAGGLRGLAFHLAPRELFPDADTGLVSTGLEHHTGQVMLHDSGSGGVPTLNDPAVIVTDPAIWRGLVAPTVGYRVTVTPQQALLPELWVPVAASAARAEAVARIFS